MCLIVGQTRNKNRRFVYKVLYKTNYSKEWFTPYREYEFSGPVLEAYGEPQVGRYGKGLNGGAIHVFTCKQHAIDDARDENFRTYRKYFVVKCEVDPNDWIADGYFMSLNSAAYKKITLTEEVYEV